MLASIAQCVLAAAEQQGGGAVAMTSQVPWIALSVSVFALFLAYNNYRLSHTVVVEVFRCEASCVTSIYEGTYYHFTIYLRNIGIPLHDVGMSLCYRPPSTGGTATLPMQTRDNHARREGQFAKGMIAEFTFRSDRL